MGVTLDKNTNKKLDDLLQLSTAQLRSLWADHFGEMPRFRARRDFLMRCLAYRLQEQAFGALNATTRNRLRKLAIELLTSPAAVLTGRSGGSGAFPVRGICIQVETR